MCASAAGGVLELILGCSVVVGSELGLGLRLSSGKGRLRLGGESMIFVIDPNRALRKLRLSSPSSVSSLIAVSPSALIEIVDE